MHSNAVALYIQDYYPQNNFFLYIPLHIYNYIHSAYQYRFHRFDMGWGDNHQYLGKQIHIFY